MREELFHIILGILIPFLGTTIGAGCVFFVQKEIKPVIQKMLLGFASGIMVAASVWSLLIPAMEMCESAGKLAFIPAAVGFSIGMLFLWMLDKLIPHLHMGSDTPEGPKSNLKKTTMLVFAVTLHNLPEGMAVGVVFAGLLTGSAPITVAGAFALTIGIAIQNFPEGSDHLPAITQRRAVEASCVYHGNVVRCGRADRGIGYNFMRKGSGADRALHAGVCSRGHDLCGRGGADPGICPGRTFGYGNHGICGGVPDHDDSGCDTRVILNPIHRKRQQHAAI